MRKGNKFQGNQNMPINTLSQIVKLAPNRPASYNNRAQCLRLAGRPDAALRDLDQAISLSDGGKGRAGSAALCQRGVLHRKVRIGGLCLIDQF